MAFWLLKTEPGAYSWRDLENEPGHITSWDGVRNYQARNYMQSMKKGDRAFFYHSVVKPMAIMGIVEIFREAHPDFTQFDPASPYYDPKGTSDNPRWFCVDVRLLHKFETPVIREQLKEIPQLEKMVLLQKGSRLSVQPVTEEEWLIICRLGGYAD